MIINWDNIQHVLSPIKDYEDVCHRLAISFGYPFVCSAYNFTLSQLIDYTDRLLGADTRQRYTEYASKLIALFEKLIQAGVDDVQDLKIRTSSRAQLELFTQMSGIEASDTANVLKYLIYWFIPNEKYLSGLVKDNLRLNEVLKMLAGLGIRTNLKLLQAGINAAGRSTLVEKSGLSPDIITNVVNLADFSRLPWTSKATISNIIEAGYGSLRRLASANSEQLYADFYRYGESIGKNLKLGNEIENSHRIAKIIPAVLQDD